MDGILQNYEFVKRRSSQIKNWSYAVHQKLTIAKSIDQIVQYGIHLASVQEKPPSSLVHIKSDNSTELWKFSSLFQDIKCNRHMLSKTA